MNVGDVKYRMFDFANYFMEMAEDQMNKGNSGQSIEYDNKHDGIMAVIESLKWDSEYYNKFSGL